MGGGAKVAYLALFYKASISPNTSELTNEILWFSEDADEATHSLNESRGLDQVSTQVLEVLLQVSDYHEAEETVQSTESEYVHGAL